MRSGIDLRTSRRVIGAVLLLVVLAGCGRKTVSGPSPPPPTPATTAVADRRLEPPKPPVVSFWVEPAFIQPPQSSMLRWEVVGDATAVSIAPDIGEVRKSGSARISPNQSTPYTLTATGAGGTATSFVLLRVGSVPPPVSTIGRSPTGTSAEQRLASAVEDVYFDYDRSEVAITGQDAVSRNADALTRILAEFPGLSIVLEGHCDDTGSAEYNLGLGDRRSSFTKTALVGFGIPADRILTVSYGKERPQCMEADESCWRRNRRVHFAVRQ